MAIIALSFTSASPDATIGDEQLAQQLQEVIIRAQEHSGSLMKWKIEKITVLEDP
jgi:hypothetical protein